MLVVGRDLIKNKSITKYLLSILTCIVLSALGSPAFSADESASEQTRLSELLESLADAENEQQGRTIETEIWAYWMDQSPTPEVRTALDAGMERREAYDYEAAENHLDKVVELAPDYAEGYNQRAFVRFLRQNYADSQSDLETALELEPNHFGAMSGLFHILRIQNRHEAAMSLLQRAVSIHPWIQERSALPKDMWPESYRDIHEPRQDI